MSEALEELLASSAHDFEGLDQRLRTARLRAALFGGSSEAVELGRYVLERELGAGAMGMVFLARDPALNRRVVLKTIHPTHRRTLERRRRLLAEAHALARLEHPNIVTVHDIGETDEEMFVALEYVEGPTIRQWLDDEPSADEIVAAYLDAARGLSAAHRAGVVHRDFKPDNAVLGPDGRVRIVDFGLAIEDCGQHVPSAGTPAYMAPEQRSSGTIDKRADQYAWATSALESLGSKRAELSRGIVRALERACADDPNARWPNLDDAVATIERDQSRRRVRRRWYEVIASTAAVLLVALCGYALYRMPSAQQCADSAMEHDAPWSAARRTAIDRAFASWGHADATTLQLRVDAELDERRRSWTRSMRHTCRWTWLEDPTAVGQRACLMAAKLELATVVDRLGENGSEELTDAYAALLGVPSSSQCLEADTTELWTTADEEAVRVLGRARGLHGSTEEHEAATVLERLSVTLEERPEQDVLLSAVLLELGISLVNLGRYSEAEEILMRSRTLADRAEHQRLEALARAKLVNLIGLHLRRPDAALTLFRSLASSRDDELDSHSRSNLHTAVGLVHHASGRHSEAVEAHFEALELRRADGDEWAMANSMHNIGVALAMAGEHDDGWSWIERALPLLERRAGPNHRDVADLSLALASISLREHEYDDALLWYGRAIEILETNFGADDPRIVHPLAGLGLAELALGRMDGAWVAFTRMHEVETRHGSLAGNREKALAGMNEAALALGIPVTLTSR